MRPIAINGRFLTQRVTGVQQLHLYAAREHGRRIRERDVRLARLLDAQEVRADVLVADHVEAHRAQRRIAARVLAATVLGARRGTQVQRHAEVLRLQAHGRVHGAGETVEEARLDAAGREQLAHEFQ